MAGQQVKILTILTAALCTAGLVWVFGKSSSSQTVRWDPDASVQVWSVNKERVVGIDAVQADSSLSLRLEEGVWWVTAPARFLASPGMVSAALDDVADIQYGILTPRQEPAEYGLSESNRAVVSLYLEEGTKHEIFVGDAAPVGWQTYVQTSGGEIVVVPGKLEETLLQKGKDYRDRALLRFALSESKSVTIKSTAGTLDVYEEDGSWWVRNYGRANLDRVDELFVGLANLRFEGWLDNVAVQGIEEPIFDVEVTLKSGATHGFQVGTSMPMGRLVQSSSGATGYVPEPVLAMLNQGPNHVADPNAFPFSASETMAITIEIDGKVLNIVASESGEGWTFSEDGASADTVVSQLALVQAEYIQVPPKGFSGPSGTVTLRYHSGKTRTIRIGPAIDAPERWCAMDTGQNSYYYLDDSSWLPLLQNIKTL